MSNDWFELSICVNLFTHSAGVLVINVYGNFPHYKSGTCGNESNWAQFPESGAEVQDLLIFQHRLISLHYRSLNTSDSDLEISQNTCCVSQRSPIYSFILHTCVCVCVLYCGLRCWCLFLHNTLHFLPCDDSVKRISSATVTTIWSNPQRVQCFTHTCEMRYFWSRSLNQTPDIMMSAIV